MSKNKAIVCTILYTVVMVCAITSTVFVKNEELGINLYQIVTGVIANLWLGSSVEKFYKWLIK